MYTRNSQSGPVGGGQQQKKAKAGKRGKRIKVPIEIGFGPAGYSFLGALANDQLLHPGIAVSADAHAGEGNGNNDEGTTTRTNTMAAAMATTTYLQPIT